MAGAAIPHKADSLARALDGERRGTRGKSGASKREGLGCRDGMRVIRKWKESKRLPVRERKGVERNGMILPRGVR